MDPYGLNHHGDENPGLGIRRKQHETSGSRYMAERFRVLKKIMWQSYILYLLSESEMLGISKNSSSPTFTK